MTNLQFARWWRHDVRDELKKSASDIEDANTGQHPPPHKCEPFWISIQLREPGKQHRHPHQSIVLEFYSNFFLDHGGITNHLPFSIVLKGAKTKSTKS
jgi:hypothetical protein